MNANRMEAVFRPDDAPVPHGEPGREPEVSGPRRLLWRCVLWLLLSCVFALLGGVLVRIGVGIAQARGAVVGPAQLVEWAGLGGNYGFMAGLLWGAVRGGKAAGLGSLRAGLAMHPARRRGLLAGLCVVAVLAPMGIVLLQDFGFVQRYSSLPESSEYLLAHALHQAALILVLAPVAEELFFRGWLWTGLRRHWGPGRAFAATAVPFLLLHLPYGVVSMLLLVPVTAAVSVARERCGSVYASMLVHFVNNACAVAAAFALRA